jgi:hypothetical protein
MRNVTDKILEKVRTRFMFHYFFSSTIVFFLTVEKYGGVGQATDDNITRRMRIACWITKATETHSEYVILIAFPLQQWLQERVSMLRYTYIVCLVLITNLMHSFFIL